METKHVARARIVVWRAGMLLVVSRAARTGASGYNALPGGHVEPGESPAECAARETQEELGLLPALGDLWYLGINAYQGRRRRIVETVHYFAAALPIDAAEGPVPTAEARLLAWLKRPSDLARERCLPPGVFARILADGPAGPPRTVTITEGGAAAHPG